MISTKKLVEMARKWQRLAAASRKRISFPRSNSIRKAQQVEKGHFVVYTSDERRFALPLAYLQSEILIELLRMAEEEFGLAGDGPITLPCDSVLLEYAISIVQRGIGRELTESLLLSLSHCRCSSLAHQQLPIRFSDLWVLLPLSVSLQPGLKLATLSMQPIRSFTLAACLAWLITSISTVDAGSPSALYSWRISYGEISPLGVAQQVILINGEFPGPEVNVTTNDNIIVNVINHLPEPFLLSWNGLQQRKNSFEDGVLGTTCPIPPGGNFTYKMQAKDQIGTFFYFPSTAFHKAAGGFGAIRIHSRPLIPVPFPAPADEFTFLIGDWYKANHTSLKAALDNGTMIPPPDGVLINGKGPNGASFTLRKGYTYRFRISNVGLRHSLNFRIEGHKMKLVEVEGTHTVQTRYNTLDVHLGQSCSVLVTADQEVRDYYIAVSTRFTDKILTTTAILHYGGSRQPVSGPPPVGPTNDIIYSLRQAYSIRTNLTASGPRPNPQGSYHYGQIPVNKTIWLESSAALVGGKQRYAINSASFVPADTPLKLADYFNISGVFRVGSIPDRPTGEKMKLETSVMGADYRAFVEIVIENPEYIVQSWHLDGYGFFVVGMDWGPWAPKKRNQYNLNDAIFRCTTQVYPRSWTAVYVALDNVGMWNLRTEFWARQYLGQQFYLRVNTTSKSVRDEYLIPENVLLCGKAR